MAFNKVAFETAFDASLVILADSEKVSKAQLTNLSRSVLEAHHETEDIGYIKRLVAVLSPMNRKTANLYFAEFSGFQFNLKSEDFGKKDKKNYEEVKEKAVAFLEDPLNNLWTWAARNIVMEAKEFDEDRMRKAFENTIKKADKEGFTQVQMLKSFISAGLKIDTLMLLIDEQNKQMAE